VKRLRLPRQLANDGKALVVVDVAELAHKPMSARSPAGDHPISATVKARVEALQAELMKLEATAAGHRADLRATDSQPRKRWPGLSANARYGHRTPSCASRG
jgi:hypothetical protein